MIIGDDAGGGDGDFHFNLSFGEASLLPLIMKETICNTVYMYTQGNPGEKQRDFNFQQSGINVGDSTIHFKLLFSQKQRWGKTTEYPR